MTTRQRWYPSQQDFSDPQKMERVMREVLDRLYTLAESHEATSLATRKTAIEVGELKSVSTIPSTSITSVDVIDQGDLVGPDQCATFTVTATNGVFSLSWTDPVNNIQTLDNFAVQYTTDAAFTTGVHGPYLLGKINSFSFTEPSVTYYFRIAAHNQSNDPNTNNNALLNALLDGGWGEWKNYGAPTAVASGGMTITAGTFQTGLTNPRIIIDSNGVRGYNASGVKQFEIATDGYLYTFDIYGNPKAALPTALTSADVECGSIGYFGSGSGDGIITFDGTSVKIKAYASTDWATINSSGLTLDTPLSVGNGGTGSTSAANARTALDVYSKAEVDAMIPSGTRTSTANDGPAHTHDITI